MNILDYLQNHPLILDGGMGTLLQASGLQPGEVPERWNITHPEIITGLQKAYYDAGSNVVNTNTFGANNLKFEEPELDRIICEAVRCSRNAMNASTGRQPKFVALDIGPTGKMLEPYGDLPFEKAVSTFARTVQLGVLYGVDLIMIETMNDSLETKAALLAAKENSSLPVFVSNAYGADGKLMTGACPASMVAMLEGMGADAIGLNCSLGPDALLPVLRQYLSLASVPVLFKPNAGLPRMQDGKTVYDVTPDNFAKTVLLAAHEGARIIGGCCGTTPDYIRPLAQSAPAEFREPEPVQKRTVISSYTHTVTFGDAPVLIGERINPTGKKRLKQALHENDMTYILEEGVRQQELGAAVLDVNVGLPDINETEMLRRVVRELQAVTDLPLQIDTSDPTAMEASMRVYNGKPLVNSVNGKVSSMQAIFPLVKKYGGVVIALTLDENGIPGTPEGRLAVAQKILDTASSYGIDKEDIIFDPLAMTVSASPDAAVVTLAALKLIRERLTCCTSLGVSNISYGLPRRDILTASFFAMALQNGLNAAIMNPGSREMMQVYHAYLALTGQDPNCADYIRYVSALPENSQAGAFPASAVSPAPQGQSDLQDAIIKGLKQAAGSLCKSLCRTIDPMQLVNEDIIPALNEVGKGYENHSVYLPQLLMSAEAAASAFEQIKEALLSSHQASSPKCQVVIATVHGDIHDIGKNIVKLLLENYGFAVTDLGKDVPPEIIVDTVMETHAPLLCLSALMTTTVPAMEETIRLIHEKAPWCKTCVGGAVLTQEYADRIHADKYSPEAMVTVRYAEEINASLHS